VITPISLDHQEYLGPDIRIIAGEKSGIARKDVPFVVAPQVQEAMEVLSVMGYQQGAPLFRYGYEWGVTLEEESFRFASEQREIDFPLPNLVGAHQITNAATAIAALTQLKGYTLSDDAIWHGLTHAYWPARLQRIETGLSRLLPQGWELWLDGAHNAGGAAVISQWADAEEDKPLYMIFGTTRGKDAEAFFREFKGKATEVYGVQVKSEPRSYNAEDVVSIAHKTGLKAKPAEDIKDAIENILASSDEPGRVLVCGSLFLAADLSKESANI
jgi:dihydrofolate synthase/folylpolyglutamate synthase